MSKYIIPLDGGEANANQTLSVQLDDFYVELELHYQQNGQWLMYIKPDGDTTLPTYTVNETEYICPGVMLEPGCDIISAYNLTDTFGQMFIVGTEPDLDNLGTDNQLVWYSSDEAMSYS